MNRAKCPLPRLACAATWSCKLNAGGPRNLVYVMLDADTIRNGLPPGFHAEARGAPEGPQCVWLTAGASRSRDDGSGVPKLPIPGLALCQNAS